MAVVNVKSVQVSNFDAQPRILTNPWIALGSVEAGVGIVACGATDSGGSTYRVGFIRSGDFVNSLQVMNDANAAGTSYKFGVALNTQDGGALPVTFADQIFASAVSMVGARSIFTEILFPSILNAGGLAANTNLRVWELLGLTVDPFKEYHLLMTAVTPGTGGGNVAVKYSLTH